MTINPGQPLTVGMPLILCGASYSVPEGAVLTAQLFLPDMSASLSSVVSPDINAIGADWSTGLIVCEFSANDTYACVPPLVLLVLTLAFDGDTRQFIRGVNVAETPPLNSIFSYTDVQELKTDRLMLVSRQFFPRAVLSDAYIFRKLRAAEALTARELRVLLKPTQVLPPNHQTDAEELSYTSQGIPILEEPGYDYDPQFFGGNSWGWMQLRQRPATAVQEIALTYPSQLQSVFVVPNDWVRLDKKYGRLSLVPTQTVASIALDGYIMSAIGGGSVIPLMLTVKYTAGLPDARDDYPDLIDVIYKRTVLSIIEDKFMPTSGSVSADGLSQSISFKAQDYRELITSTLDSLSRSISGPQMMVV